MFLTMAEVQRRKELIVSNMPVTGDPLLREVYEAALDLIETIEWQHNEIKSLESWNADEAAQYEYLLESAKKCIDLETDLGVFQEEIKNIKQAWEKTCNECTGGDSPLKKEIVSCQTELAYREKGLLEAFAPPFWVDNGGQNDE